jgi:hypothetical protein
MGADYSERGQTAKCGVSAYANKRSNKRLMRLFTAAMAKAGIYGIVRKSCEADSVRTTVDSKGGAV